jgi:hypothetical protein
MNSLYTLPIGWTKNLWTISAQIEKMFGIKDFAVPTLLPL